MRYAFSTLGVPGMPVRDVAELAADTGYHGVELRAHPEEPVHPALSGHERAAVAGEFGRVGVQVLAVAGYARVAAPGADAHVLHEIRELSRLARDLGAPYVRIFPGADLGTGEDRCWDVAEVTDAAEATCAGRRDAADRTAVRRLAAAAREAAGTGVRVLLETHDSHRTGASTARILGAVAHPGAGALWDVLHTWLGGESPAATHAALAPYPGYTQVKDVASAVDLTPLPLGAGVLPLAACVAFAKESSGMRGADWLCWEYERRWYGHAADLPALLAPGRAHLETLVREARRR
ncbi:sugar phosphate isomerase/epimerase family protein [Streptomyces sp. 549]|uniref:sugar phosphate isomerase/epimerase family protein n=1 Tax=Streptomyces sp. 549 TaxID=3049076 RepID=UPI0024C30B51|nr:sugar phosphate isomerase/epimerase family protein [Streptomyces sp. 549]MDK1476636.1 sugar phosphate isomerase/epimerase family protein [Streptomyces sp. 549]